MATTVSSHDPFKWQDAGDNHHKHQQGSVLPARNCQGQDTHKVEDAFDYTSILELPDDEKRLLEDIISLTDIQELRGAPERVNQSAYHIQERLTPDIHTEQTRYGMACPSYSANPNVTNDLSKYALNAIFQNLIYPDVCQGQFFTLDTLVQTTHDETNRSGYVRNSKSGQGMNSGVTYEMESMSSLHGPSRDHRYGKRKRSRDLSHDVDDRKRVKCVQSAHDSNSFHFDSASHPRDNGRYIVHKRVRELMCHI